MTNSGQTESNPRILQFHNKIKQLNRFKADRECAISDSESESVKKAFEKIARLEDRGHYALTVELVDI
jgi:hypothetical protein